jgi:hypothetical protein
LIQKDTVGPTISYILNTMKKFLFVIVLFLTSVVMACECPPVSSITLDLAKNYDIIFIGKIDSVSACATNGISIATFTISELYKGNSIKQAMVHFDCVTSCMMSFARNEEWIIYANYQRFDVISVKLCSHSRKYFQPGEQDFYLSAAKRTFDEEKEFLKSGLGVQPFIENESWNKDQQELRPHNDQPSSQRKIMLLLVSFIVMILIYIITRKKRRKNG